MAKFVLIDPNIREVGGHYYEYAVRVLQAAEEAGFEPVLATNHTLKTVGRLPWRVVQAYRYDFFEPGPPRLLKAVCNCVSALRHRAARFKHRCLFSPLGVLWSKRREHKSVIAGGMNSHRLIIVGVCVEASLYAVRLIVALGRFALVVVPVGGYLASVGRAARQVAAAAVRPWRSLIAHRWVVWHQVHRWRKRTAFAADSLRLFREIGVNVDDVFFIPTLTEADMLGLGSVFGTNPETTKATWHLIFRRNIYQGRDPDYARQEESLRPLRNAFRQFQTQLCGQSVRFYTDTDELTVQYDRIGVAAFSTAPIPIATDYRATHRGSNYREADAGHPLGGSPWPASGTRKCAGRSGSWGGNSSLDMPAASDPSREAEFVSLPTETPGTPRTTRAVGTGPNNLRHVVYIGDARTEKGYHWLPHLVDDAFARRLPVRFTFQSNFNVPGGEPAAAVARAQLEALSPERRVVLLKQPLDSGAYRQLLFDADIVVIPYERDNYYARSSGIFAEALVAGKPVIVPAGTWMATALAASNCQYHEALRHTHRPLRTFTARELTWTANSQRLRRETQGLAQERLSLPGASPACCWLSVPANATHLLVTCEIDGNARGVFASIATEHFGRGRALLRRATSIAGGAPDQRPSALFCVDPDTRRIRLGLSNGLANLPMALSQVRIDFLSAPGGLALRAVGGIYADPSELSGHVEELVNHYEHYHATASAFSADWSVYHCPQRLLEQLVGRERLETMAKKRPAVSEAVESPTAAAPALRRAA